MKHGPGYNPLFFPACEFFQTEVQVPVGSLTRPVTGHDVHDDAGHSEHSNDHDGGLHHVSVPWMLPRTRAMMIAEMNTPAMM